MKALPHGSLPRHATVLEAAPASRSLRRIRLGSPDLVDQPWIPGQQVRIDVGDGSEEGLTLRTYSVHDYDPKAGWIDLIVHLHGNGPGSLWAEAAKAGEQALLFGPLGSFVLNQTADWHLFLGDETGAPALQPMLRSLSPEVPAFATFEADQEDDRLAPVQDRIEERWVFRKGQEPGRSSPLVASLADFDPPAGFGTAYLAGEMGATLGMRDFLLKEKGFQRRQIRCKTFWAKGKVGLT